MTNLGPTLPTLSKNSTKEKSSAATIDFLSPVPSCPLVPCEVSGNLSISSLNSS